MSATVSDVLDLDIHGLAIEVWPGVERIVRMRFPVDTDLSDDWTFTVPHAIGDAYAIDGDVGESGDEDAEGPRPQVSFTLPAERMRDILRRPFVIAVGGVPKISGPVRIANVQSSPGETTVSVTLVEPQAIDVSLTIVDGGGGGGGGDVYLDVANVFTAMQSIDVDVPVTPLADAGTVKPTVLVHLHDDEGPRVDLWASSIDFGGGVVVSSAGRLTRRVGIDGVPTDTYLLESYAFVGISTITSEPLYRLVMAEVESTDPGELPWLSDLFNVTLASVRVGEPTEPDDAATKHYVDATVVAVGPTPPPEPADVATAVWNRTQGNVRGFLDLRLVPDGPVDGIKANGVGSIDPPPVVRSFTELYPQFGGEPATVTGGAVRSSGVPVDGPDPVPRTGFTLDGVAPGVRGRIEWGFAGFTETDGVIDTYNPTNIGISAPYTDLPEGAVGPHAYLAGFVVGKFVGDSDVTDESEEESLRLRLIRDDWGSPTTLVSVQIPRDAIPHIDRIGYTYDNDTGRFGIELNGVELATATDTTHDISTFTSIGMVMHQDYNAWLCGVEWFGISDGDQITGDLGPHRWIEGVGWVPIGPGARAALNAVTSVNGETGTVVLTASDVGADPAGTAAALTATDVGADPAGTAAALVDDLSGVSNASVARSNLGLGGAAILSVGTTTGTVAAGDDARLAAAITEVRVPASWFVGANGQGVAPQLRAIGTSASRSRTGVIMADSASTSVWATMPWLPWTSVDVYLDMFNLNASTGGVRWQVHFAGQATTHVQMTAYTATLTVSSSAAGDDTTYGTYWTGAVGTSIAVTQANLLSASVTRLGSDGADTLAGSIYFMGLRFRQAGT